jgi:hypothetical protein
MMSKIPADKKWRERYFPQSLKAGVTAGDFVQVKASYKLSQDYKKKPSQLKRRPRLPRRRSRQESYQEGDCPKKKLPPPRLTATEGY